jgi:hypothetical protein
MSESTHHHPPLLVFAEDWGRHVSACQHIIRHLLDRYQVLWVNTIGTRKPRLDRASLSRGVEKVYHWLTQRSCGERAHPNLRILNAVMWPWFSSRFDRRLNRELLFRQLAPVLRALPEPPVAITKIPIVADLMGLLPVKRWVYYVPDDFSSWPGLDQPTMQTMEQEVVRKADVLITVSECLQEKLARLGRSSHLLTHGVDVDHWTQPPPGRLPHLQHLQPPLVTFWGLIDRRMDVPWVNRLASDLPHGTVLFVGPEADPDPALYRTPRVTRLPPLHYNDLPRLAQASEVLIMPYADLPVTRAMQPLKLKEYLSTDRPVVVRHLPATRGWADCLDLAETSEGFSQQVRLRLAEGLPPEQRSARGRLAEEHWARKAQIFEEWALHGEY